MVLIAAKAKNAETTRNHPPGYRQSFLMRHSAHAGNATIDPIAINPTTIRSDRKTTVSTARKAYLPTAATVLASPSCAYPSSMRAAVCSQPMHESVMETPYFRSARTP